MPLPTFLIVGVQKCGTSSLVKTLRRHPQLQLSRPKELHFFDHRRDRGLDWYAEHFTEEPGVTQWGEATPAYLYFRHARLGINEVLPDAKLVVVLRDPVKRAHSHFWHAKRTKRETVDTFEEGLALEEERLAGDHHSQVRFSYVDRGHYVDQLEDLVEIHGRDKVHVMLIDDLNQNRVPTLTSLFEFLDVDTAHAETIPELWAYRYRNIAESDGESEKTHYTAMRPETRQQLAEHFEPYNKRLEQWLGRDLPQDWKRP